jgi:putative ABC transport system substrate-binding protein
LHRPVAGFAAIAASGASAIYLNNDPALAGTGQVRKQVSEWALKRGLPVGSPNARVASDGGLLSFGTDFNVLNRRAAAYGDWVLKGAKPVDLPVEHPSVFNLAVKSIPLRRSESSFRSRCCCARTR